MSLISRPQSLLLIRIPSLTVMAFSFLPDYHVTNQTASILKKRNNPFRDHLWSRTLARPREGLWVYYSCHMVKKRAVMREWCHRRMRAALKEELQKRGFDADGQFAGDGTGRGEKNKSDLAGTLELWAFTSLLVTKRSEVCRQAGLIAETVEKMCRDQTKSKARKKAIWDVDDRGAWKRP